MANPIHFSIRSPATEAASKNVANEVGQTAVDHVVKKEPADKSIADFINDEDFVKSSNLTKLRSYAKDVISLPSAATVNGRHRPANLLVKVLIMIAVVVFTLGLLVVFFKLAVGMLVILVGALPIALIILSPAPSHHSK